MRSIKANENTALHPKGQNLQKCNICNQEELDELEETPFC